MNEIKDFSEALRISGESIIRVTGMSRSQLEKDIQKIKEWAAKSGKKWVTTRLKDLKTIVLSYLADLGSKPSWYCGRKTTYKGRLIPALRIFSTLVNCIENNNHRGIRSILDLLNTYNVFAGPGDDVNDKIEVITDRSSVISREIKVDLTARLTKCFPLKKRKTPYALKFHGPDIGGARYASEPLKNSDCLAAMMPSISTIPEWIWERFPDMKQWVNDHSFFGEVTSKWGETLFHDGKKEPGPFWAGNLAVLGESGLKTRLVFVGNPWIQGLLKPAVVPLQRCLLMLGTDCTFDQDKGREWLREATERGDTIHSIDLSAATDNFPFFLQNVVGQLVGLHKDILKVLHYSGFYNPVVGKTYGPVSVYAKGQGMGLYPSFALFALTHNVLLHTLSKELGLDPLASFRILGDDVIISNGKLANLYRETLNDLHVPISERKSFSSSQFGEFAGKLFWKGHDVTPIKWRHVTQNSIDVVSQYIDRGMVEIDHANQKVKSIPLGDKSVYPHAEALLVLPKALGGFERLTRLSLSERLGWGRRVARSLRAGYLERVTQRITAFLSGEQALKNIDVSKYSGMFDQCIKLRHMVNRARRFGGNVMPMPPGGTDKDDIPSSREGLKDLESIAFGTDSLEERLGKYHAWYIAMLGPNPVREFNRLVTQSGQPVDLIAVPVVGSSMEAKRLLRLRHLPPHQVHELYEQAEERVKLLQGMKDLLRDGLEPLETAETGISLGKVLGTTAATAVNPALGIAVGAISLLSSSDDDNRKDQPKPRKITKLAPV